MYKPPKLPQYIHHLQVYERLGPILPLKYMYEEGKDPSEFSAQHFVWKNQGTDQHMKPHILSFNHLYLRNQINIIESV